MAQSKTPVSLLNEYCQKHALLTPVYADVSKIGPSHNPRFVVSVKVGTRIIQSNECKTKQAAKHCAAKKMLHLLTEPPPLLGRVLQPEVSYADFIQEAEQHWEEMLLELEEENRRAKLLKANLNDASRASYKIAK